MLLFWFTDLPARRISKTESPCTHLYAPLRFNLRIFRKACHYSIFVSFVLFCLFWILKRMLTTRSTGIRLACSTPEGRTFNCPLGVREYEMRPSLSVLGARLKPLHQWAVKVVDCETGGSNLPPGTEDGIRWAITHRRLLGWTHSAVSVRILLLDSISSACLWEMNSFSTGIDFCMNKALLQNSQWPSILGTQTGMWLSLYADTDATDE